MPILDWTKEDVAEYIKLRGIKIHPLYYREDGTIDTSRRLGCMCCPLASKRLRIEEFKRYPRMVKAYIRAGSVFYRNHPNSVWIRNYKDIYEVFVRDVFYESDKEFNEAVQGMFGRMDCKKFLEDFFKIKL